MAPFAAGRGNLVSLSDRRKLREEDRAHGHVEVGSPEQLDIDGPARERAEGWITDLYRKIEEAESLVSMLGVFVEDRSIGAAAVGSIGIDFGELREKLPILREVVREMDPDWSGGDAA